MKIPETPANIGAYYGNEENGQWQQPNGLIIDSGVGGGVVGSGDAGIHRPPVYPVHIPRGHVPAGYVMASAYYPPVAGAFPAAPPHDDFADYMWMENEEEFDKQVMQQLEEEALMEQCIEAMLEDEQRERRHTRVTNGHHHLPTTSNGRSSLSLEETVSRSTLNPLAAEFVPTRSSVQPTTHTQLTTDVPEDKQTPSDTTPVTEETLKSREVEEPTADSKPDSTEEPKTEEPVPPPKDPPEVSAADVQPIDKQDKRPKDKRDIKKVDPKKQVKVDVKKKPQVVKSETKVQPKKKEVKSVKSEVKVDEMYEEVIAQVDVMKIQPAPVEEKVQSTPGIKPINYAAAAKANKPKKSTTPPVSDKSTPPPQIKAEKPKIFEKKDKVKTEKPSMQRKNSAK